MGHRPFAHAKVDYVTLDSNPYLNDSFTRQPKKTTHIDKIHDYT